MGEVKYPVTRKEVDHEIYWSASDPECGYRNPEDVGENLDVGDVEEIQVGVVLSESIWAAKVDGDVRIFYSQISAQKAADIDYEKEFGGGE